MSETNAHVLDIEGARQWLAAHGMEYEFRQVQRMATEKKLPFFKGFDGKKLFVREVDLERAVAEKAAGAGK